MIKQRNAKFSPLQKKIFMCKKKKTITLSCLNESDHSMVNDSLNLVYVFLENFSLTAPVGKQLEEGLFMIQISQQMGYHSSLIVGILLDLCIDKYRWIYKTLDT